MPVHYYRFLRIMAKGRYHVDEMERKWLLICIMMGVALFLGLVAWQMRVDKINMWYDSLIERGKTAEATESAKPKVVDFFACGDNCPGPESKYTVKVYEGVTSSEECAKWGGRWKSFVGWGTTYYCQAR